MKSTAEDLKEFGVIDEIIEEPEGGAQEDFENVAENIRKYLIRNLEELRKLDVEELLEKRYKKFRKM